MGTILSWEMGEKRDPPGLGSWSQDVIPRRLEMSSPPLGTSNQEGPGLGKSTQPPGMEGLL